VVVVAASYPAAVATTTRLPTDITDDTDAKTGTPRTGLVGFLAALLTAQDEEIRAIETELGTDPAASFTDVKSRLNARLTCRKTADTTNATTTAANITDLTLPVSTTAIDYWFRFFVCWSSGTTGAAAQFAITVPTVAGYVYYWIDTMGSASTAPSTSSTGSAVTMTSHNASGSAQAATGGASAAAPPTSGTIYGCKIEGILSNPSATGSIVLQGKAETTGTITFKRGSWGEVYVA
jgi:hypothetical protein